MTRLLTLFLIAILPALSIAQVSGIVSDTKRQPIVGAAVVVDGTQTGSATDAKGSFYINTTDFPLSLVVSCLGFQTDTFIVEKPTKRLSIVLQETTHTTSEVDVVAQRGNGDLQSLDASKAIAAADVAGGIESIVKTQMGVSSSSELSSQYRVRGGNFDENMVYVNNIEIFRPFLVRSGEQEGLSFVNPDLVESVDFSSGGFDASYSDKMSSVLDVHYKSPSTFCGAARISLLGANAYFGGKTKSGFHSHVTGVRYKTNRYMLGSMDTDGEYSPTFFDAQTYHTVNFTPKLALNILGYFATNKYEFEPENRETNFGTITDAKTFTIYFEGSEDDSYLTALAAANLTYAPSNDHSFTANASIYRTKEEEYYDILGEYWLQQAAGDNQNIGVGGYLEHARNQLLGTVSSFAIRGNDRISANTFSWEFKAQNEEFKDYIDQWEYVDSAGYIASATTGEILFDNYVKQYNVLNSSRYSAFLIDRLTFDRPNGTMNLVLGLRASYWDCNKETIVSPRASFSYITNNWNFRIAAGRYCQAPFFRELRRADGTLNRNVKSQKSWQILLGADKFFKRSEIPFKFTVEAYYKALSDLNPYSVDNVRITYMADNCATGYAVGIDAKLNGELVEGQESWVCLSIMGTEEDIEGDGHGRIPRPSDQRVSFSMFLNDHMPANQSMVANLSVYLATGLPFGPPDEPRYMATYRMPGYKRIDLGLYKDFAITREGAKKFKNIDSIRLGIDIFNLFNISNTISYLWINDTSGGTYAVPNYLTPRRINLRFAIEF